MPMSPREKELVDMVGEGYVLSQGELAELTSPRDDQPAGGKVEAAAMLQTAALACEEEEAVAGKGEAAETLAAAATAALEEEQQMEAAAMLQTAALACEEEEVAAGKGEEPAASDAPSAEAPAE